MKKFEDIKSELKQKNYSKVNIKFAIIAYIILKYFFSRFSILVFSAIPFIVGVLILGPSVMICLLYLIIHLSFYYFYVDKVYTKDIKPIYQELVMIISALREIKSEIN